MKLKSALPLLLALVIAIVAVSWVHKKKNVSASVDIQKVQTIPVVAAVANLEWGTKLEKEMLKTVPFLEESLPQGHISKPEEIVGRVLISTLMTNEPVTASKLAPKDVTIGGVSAFLAPGKRAMAVKGDKVIGLSGLIRPGNIVDIFVTVNNPKTKKETTKIVLEKIKVLATGDQIQEKSGEKEEKTSPYDVYTLEVTPQQGELLALAATKGKLQFALRNVTDIKTVLTKGTTIDQALSSLSNINPPAKIKKKYPKRFTRKYFTVETIDGDKVKKKRFRQ